MVGAPPQLGPLVNDQKKNQNKKKKQKKENKEKEHKKQKNHQSLSPEIHYTLASPDLVELK